MSGYYLVCLVARSVELPHRQTVAGNTIRAEYAIKRYYSYIYARVRPVTKLVRPLLFVCGVFDNQGLASGVLCIKYWNTLSSLFVNSLVVCHVGNIDTPDSSVYKEGVEGPGLELLKGYCHVRGERPASAAAGASVYEFASARRYIFP